MFEKKTRIRSNVTQIPISSQTLMSKKTGLIEIKTLKALPFTVPQAKRLGNVN